MYYYKLNNSNEFIEFNESNLPTNIEKITEVKVFTKDSFHYIKHPDFLNNNILNDRETDKEYHKAMIKFNDIIEYIEDLTIEEIYNELDNKGNFYVSEWYMFDEYFFDDFGISAYEAARATHFGDVNWNHDYINYDIYGNFVTTDELDWEAEEDEIVEAWIEENIH